MRFRTVALASTLLAVLPFHLTAQQAGQATTEAPAPQPPEAIGKIQKQALLGHAKFLASDELGGRLTGSPGQQMAASYIAAHFQKLGLEPLGDPAADGQGTRQFLQHYGIARTVLESAELQAGDGKWHEGFAVLGAGAGTFECKGTLRFLGLGRSRGEGADLAEGESLEGVVPVVLVRTPRGEVAANLDIMQKFGMAFPALQSLLRTGNNLQRRGAKAVVFLLREDGIGVSDVLNYVALAPGKDQVQPRYKEAGGEPGMEMMLGGKPLLPMVITGTKLSNELGVALGLTDEAVAAYLDEPSADKLPKAALAGGVSLRVANDEQAKASNVVAVLRGSDETLRNEAVVFSAHMDHVGRRLDGEVFNGADDNASGTSGLLEIARAFASGPKPKRSVIFLAVSGEELGLWGSEYYSDHPTWPLEQIIANVNTDMIGRTGPESGPMEVTVTPSHRHARFSTIVRDAAVLGASMGITFTSGDKYYARSDHYNFARKGIPVVFFCNGEHEDYHQVSDEADKLDGDKLERLARLAFWTGWNVANSAEKPETLGRQGDWK